MFPKEQSIVRDPISQVRPFLKYYIIEKWVRKIYHYPIDQTIFRNRGREVDKWVRYKLIFLKMVWDKIYFRKPMGQNWSKNYSKIDTEPIKFTFEGG
jgi:hypothetical protein